MKQVFRQVVVWAVFAVISSFGAFAQQHIHIVGHRGFWKAESAAGTQNSIASLRAAEAESLWGSEFDVQLTKDGIPIVNHDPTIPSGAQKLRIDEYTWKELSKLNLANGEKRPTLDSYIAEGAKLPDIRLVVELKRQREPDGGHAREEKLLSETVSILKKYGVFTPERVVFISFSLYICEQIAERYPAFTNQYLEGDLTPAEVKAKGINGIDYKYKVFKKHPEWVAEARELGLSVNTWTVDKEEDILQMINLGVEYITSDEPLLVRKLLNKRGVFQVEASDLTLVGKLRTDTPHIYNRVDTLAYPGLNKSEISRARMSAGIMVAFRTNSKRITVQTDYEYREEALKSSPLLYGGYDLYIRKDGKWLWAGAGVSKNNAIDQPAEIIKAMDGSMHECLLYLPMYSILNSVKIGIDGGTEIYPSENPFRHRVGIFGSSFTHAACASRPGLSYPAIFSRETGINLLSLGVSGQCKLQPTFARIIADADIDALILDAFSNPKPEEVEERIFPFIETIQAKHPDIPIIFQATIYREWRNFNTRFIKYEADRYDRCVELVKEAQKKYKNIYLVYPNATDEWHDTSADGTHPNDRGYILWAHSIEKPVLKILAKYGIK
ncbi:MAG: hypothetical protein IKX37_04975 [Bacteroidales bacterium]|nr:hypothetical protein [Bacteroidales bacterium]